MINNQYLRKRRWKMPMQMIGDRFLIFLYDWHGMAHTNWTSSLSKMSYEISVTSSFSISFLIIVFDFHPIRYSNSYYMSKLYGNDFSLESDWPRLTSPSPYLVSWLWSTIFYNRNFVGMQCAAMVYFDLVFTIWAYRNESLFLKAKQFLFRRLKHAWPITSQVPSWLFQVAWKGHI